MTRSGLLAAKLGALVRSTFGDGEREARDFPAGAALVDGGSAWLLLEPDPVKAFGAGLVWAERAGAAEVHLLAERETGVLSRRAACFADPPSVWKVEGISLVAAEADPAPRPQPPTPAPELAELLVDADLEVVVEGGVVRGEINGLEVARIVHGTSTAGMPLDEPRLEVGVGEADRELTSMVHGDLPPVDQLARVSEIVRSQRRPDAARHPLNRLVPERWLRARCIVDPARIGLAALRPVETAVPRPNLRDRAIAAAVGETATGDPVVAAFSVGVDLDLVPAAADTRLSVDPSARLLLVVPERDAHPVTTALAARLRDAAEVVTLSGDWRG